MAGCNKNKAGNKHNHRDRNTRDDIPNRSGEFLPFSDQQRQFPPIDGRASVRKGRDSSRKRCNRKGNNNDDRNSAVHAILERPGRKQLPLVSIPQQKRPEPIGEEQKKSERSKDIKLKITKKEKCENLTRREFHFFFLLSED